MTLEARISKEDGPVMLSIFKGLSQREVAKIVGISVYKVREIKKRCRWLIDHTRILWQEFWHNITANTIIECCDKLFDETYKLYDLPREEIDKWEKIYEEYIEKTKRIKY